MNYDIVHRNKQGPGVSALGYGEWIPASLLEFLEVVLCCVVLLLSWLTDCPCYPIYLAK